MVQEKRLLYIALNTPKERTTFCNLWYSLIHINGNISDNLKIKSRNVQTVEFL